MPIMRAGDSACRDSGGRAQRSTLAWTPTRAQFTTLRRRFTRTRVLRGKMPRCGSETWCGPSTACFCVSGGARQSDCPSIRDACGSARSKPAARLRRRCAAVEHSVNSRPLASLCRQARSGLVSIGPWSDFITRPSRSPCTLSLKLAVRADALRALRREWVSGGVS